MFLRYPIVLIVSLILTAVSIGSAQENQESESVTERDFAFQGEYVGTIGNEEEQMDMAMQVIAIGDGQFRIVAYAGGLPGDGWDGNDHEKIDVVGKYNSDNNSVEFRGYHRGDATIKEGILTITTKTPGVTGKLEKVVRKSETLGAKPPEGATILFDGKNTDGWKNGRVTDDGWLMQGTTSVETFGDHHLHIEFQLPFMPNEQGQRRGNSGLYVQGRYEVQMLDSFGLEGKQNECGGIYSVKAPDLNMCFPPKSWQTYDVEFQAAKFDDDGKLVRAAQMSVKHNGVLIHDNIELPARKTTAAPVDFGAAPGPVYLQNHGNEVRYRNIWAIKK